MENDIKDYRTLRSGVGLIKTSVFLLLIAVVVAIGSAMLLFTPLSFIGAGMGLMACYGLLILGGLCALIGKILCLKAPVAKQLVAGSLAMDALAVVLASTDHSTITSAIMLLSFGLFMGFFFLLGDHLNDMSICDSVRSVIKNYAISLALGFVGSLTGFGILGLAALIFAVISFLSYLAVLSMTSRALS